MLRAEEESVWQGLEWLVQRPWERHWQFQEQREEGCDWYIEREEENGK